MWWIRGKLRSFGDTMQSHHNNINERLKVYWTSQWAHLGEEPVHKDRLGLAKAVDPEDTLNVIGRVPGGVKDDDPVGRHQVDAQRAGAGGNEEQTPPVGGVTKKVRKSFSTASISICSVSSLRVLPCVAGVVELFCPLFPGGGVCGAVQAVVVDVPEPLAFTFKDTSHQIKCDGFIFDFCTIVVTIMIIVDDAPLCSILAESLQHQQTDCCDSWPASRV